MFQTRQKQIKFDENDTERHTEQADMIVDETQATSGLCSSNNSLQNVNNPKEYIVNISSDDEPTQLPTERGVYWCKIGFGTLNQCHGSYKLGKIVLELVSEEIQPNANEKLMSDFTNATIEQRFPGLAAFQIQVEGQWGESTNTVQLITRREISKEEATRMLISSKSNKRLLPKDHKYIESKHFTYNFRNLNVPPALFGKPGKLEVRKIFKINFEKFDAIYKEITLQVSVYSSAIKGDPNYVDTMADMTNAIPVWDYYCLNPIKEPSTNAALAQSRSRDDAIYFFSLMRDYHNFEIRPDPDDSIQDSRILLQLLDYQKESIVWMLCREGVLEFSDEDNDSNKQLQQLLSININKRVNLNRLGNKGLHDLYYSRASGCISWEKQKIDKLPSRGGILAEEMGLGKTIEILSLILLNPRPETDSGNVTNFRRNEMNTESEDDVDIKYFPFECTCGFGDIKNKTSLTCLDCGNSQHSDCLGFDEARRMEILKEYLCPCCISKLPPKPSKSTLIVAPDSILKQWEEEIENSILDDALKVYIYSGIGNRNEYIHPAVLFEYDVVLTTYEVLQKEIHFTDLTAEKRFRNPKRYATLPSPLILVEWWRVCLDEAQMVENINWSFAKMARMLPAVNRWCVTGTPISNGLNYLYGIVCFLGIEPISDITWWELLIMEPFKLNNSQMAITRSIFGKIFWRTEKEDVQDQMRLPRQTEVLHRLEFTTAEKYFYDERLIYWVDMFKAGIQNIERDQQIFTLSNSQLLPFLRLRHICTHPQLDDEEFKVVNIFIEEGEKLTLTVFEFVKWLVKRATARCLEQYKSQVVSLNAIAGLHLMKNELVVAATQYRCVIELAEEHKHHWKTDDINLLHALINLNDVSKKLGVGEVDGTLDTRAEELIEKLLKTKISHLNYLSIRISFNEITHGNFGGEEDACWILVINNIRNSRNSLYLFQELVYKLNKTMSMFTMNLQLNEQASNFHFSKPIMNSLVLPTCELCSFKSKLSYYESLLTYTPKEKDHDISRMTMKSSTEIILDVINELAKKYQLPATLLEAGKRHTRQFCDLKDEIQRFWNWYTKIDEKANALHALLKQTKPIEMNADSTSNHQKQINPTNFSVSEVRRLSVLQLEKLSHTIKLEMSRLARFKHKFTDSLRELQYLEGLKMYGYTDNSSIIELKAKICAVDHASQKLVFLPCGHFVCANCCPETDNYEFTCSIENCSKRFSNQVVRFIDMQSGSKHIVANIPSWKIINEEFRGNSFTKVEGVIRTLLTIQKNHRNEKTLVICTCEAMLNVFAAEFGLRNISYMMYKRRTKHRALLLHFRTDTTQVLLMPLSVASTGLNLTEASHVILVEPILNQTTEQQAIGRIHRLGQKKPTFVHRFYVADTIEEKLVQMDENKKMSSFVESSLTVQDLLDFFDKN